MRLCVGVVAIVLASMGGRALAADGTCSGFGGTVGLALPNGDGSFATINPTDVGNVFGHAECACAPTTATKQIALEVDVTTPLAFGTTGMTQVWVGVGCDDPTKQAACELIGTISTSQLTAAGLVHVAIPGNSISSPTAHSCDPTVNPSAANGVYLLAYDSLMTPLGACTLPLTEQNASPLPPNNVSGGEDDRVIVISWQAPGGSDRPVAYQVLCSDECGSPIFSGASASPSYSSCVNGALVRRPIATVSSTPAVTDMGGPDMASSDMAGVIIRDMAQPLDLAIGSDMATVAVTPVVSTCTKSAATGVFAGGTLGPLAELDSRFICSAPLAAGATSTQIGGLTDGQLYHFVVLAIDAYGNATPAAALDATPVTPQDLWQRYRADGGQGGCVTTPSAFDNRVWLLALPLLALWWWRRRTSLRSRK